MSDYSYKAEKACRALYDLSHLKNTTVNSSEIEKLVNIILEADNAYYYSQVAKILPLYKEKMFNLLRANYLSDYPDYAAVGYWLQDIDYEGNISLKRDILQRDDLYEVYLESEAYEDENFMDKFDRDLTADDQLGLIL